MPKDRCIHLTRFKDREWRDSKFLTLSNLITLYSLKDSKQWAFVPMPSIGTGNRSFNGS